MAGHSERIPRGNGDRTAASIDELFAEYAERLAAGERLDPETILAKHPTVGRDLLAYLEEFVDLDPTVSPPCPLGSLGDYELLRQSGRGGMGVVYEAWENSMDRRVALKVLPAAVAADNKTFMRFCREARLAGQLHHPNIVPVFGMGIKGEAPHYAMEFVDGDTLAQVLTKVHEAEQDTATPFGKKNDTRYFASLAEAFAEVADGLQHAHSKGIIHRDIKPSNLIRDGEGRLRILDFGLARLEGQESLTLSGDLMGTVLYMSPEQAMAKRIPLDHRTDVYSLGATLYEMLTGEPPFRGRNQHDTLSQIIVRDARPPRQLNPRVPKDLETIVLKCLRKDSADRYGTAEALGQDLSRFVRSDPVEARPEGRWERLARSLRRHRTKVSVGAVILVLLGSVAWLSWRGHQTDREKRLAEYEPALREALTGYYEARFSLEAVKTPVPFLQGRHRGSAVARENLIKPSDFRKVVTGDVVSPLAQAVDRLTELATSVPERPDALFHLAQAYNLLERRADAETAIAQVLQIDPDFVPARVLLWELEAKSQVEMDAESQVEMDAELTTLVGKYTDPDQWQHWWILARQSETKRNWTEAVHAYTRLIELVGREARKLDEHFVGLSFEARMQRGVARLEARESKNAHQDFIASGLQAPSLAPDLLLAKAYHVEFGREIAEQTFDDIYRTNSGRRQEIALWVVAMKNALWSYDEDHLRWIEQLGDSPVSDLLRANCLSRFGRAAEARVYARKAIDRDPEDPRAYVILGLCHLEELRSRQGPPEAKVLEEIVHVSRQAVELDPANSVAIELHQTAQDYHQRSIDMKLDMTLLTVFTLGLGQVALAQGFFEDVRSLGSAVNSFFFETQPNVSADGLEIFFSSGRPSPTGGMDIWRATRDSKGDLFENAVNVLGVNSTANDWPTWISPDGQRLYFMSTRRGASDMFVAQRTDPDAFEDARPLDGINTSSHEGGASLSPDELTIYYVSRQPGGQGARDIWVATRSSVDGPFENPRNLEEINTRLDESNPSISSDGLTLFWSDLVEAPRPGGMGSNDIWYATREDPEDVFGPATNLRAPVNTPQSESTGRISADWPASGSKIYFMRCGPDCFGDLYQATWVPEPQAPPTRFLRGDCTGDAKVDLTDAVCALNDLFAGGLVGNSCLAALNTNGDDQVNIADPVSLLNFLFAGGATPVAPFPECGPADADLGCDEGCQ